MRREAVLVFVASLLSPALAFLVPTASRINNQRRRVSLQMMGGDDDLDFPSDTASNDELDTAEAIAAAVTDTVREPAREAIKCKLYQLAAKTNRGQLADVEQKSDAITMVAQLEAMAPVVPSEVEGRWELLYSDVAPFRASPFFLTVGKLLGGPTASEDFFRLHRLATRAGEIGRVWQVITKQELTSEVEISTGIPSIPFEIKGTVVSRATLIRDPENSNTLRLFFKSSTVKGASILSFLNDGDLPELPLGDLYSRLASVPEVQLSTFYCDGDMRISRTNDEHFFVFVRSTL